MSGYVIPDDMQFVAEGHAEHEADMCESGWNDWGCTRYQGHDGIHEAGTDNGYSVFAVWDES